jgi:hypothetical protein
MESDATEPNEFGYAAHVEPLVIKACNCHQTSPVLMAPFSLKLGEGYANLVGVQSAQLETMLIVEPGKLNDSYLWHKINGTQAEVGGEGLIMPPTVPFNADERRVFEQWIAAGAAP